MPAFLVTTAGLHDQRAVNMAFDGITFTAPGAATVRLDATQFSPTQLNGSPLTFTGNAQTNTVEIFVSGIAFSAAAIVLNSWSASDRVILRDSILNENITGSAQNDTFFITGGNDNINNGSASVGSPDRDVVNVNWSAISGGFSMNGASSITNFSNTTLSFSTNFGAVFDFNIITNSGVGGAADSISLGAGNDSLSTGTGDDVLNMGRGTALVDGGVGNDLWVSDFSDNATAASINLNLAGLQAAGNGSSYANIERLGITGGNGNDVLISKTGNPNDGLSDTLNGGAGNDSLTVGGGSDVVDGGAGNDLLIANYTGETSGMSMNGVASITDFTNTSVSFSNIERFDLTLGDGNDNVILGAGDDTLRGGAGNDQLNTGIGAAVVDGGAGADTWIGDISADAGAKIIDIRLVGVQVAGNGTTYANLEAMNVKTGAGDDLLASANLIANDTLSTGDGNDTLAVGGGVDVVDGGLGTDKLVINYGALSGNFGMNGLAQLTNFAGTAVGFAGIEQFDVTLGIGNDSVVLGAGADTVRGGDGDDTMDTKVGNAAVVGGLGNDIWLADQSGDTRAKTINLNLIGTQTASVGTTYNGVDRIAISTGAGADRVITKTGSGGNDTVNSGAGNDTIGVGFGVDSVDGGADIDLVIANWAGLAGNFSMNGASQITSFAGTTLQFTNIERFNITLSNGDDNVVTGALADTLNGGGGNDRLNTGVGLASVDGGAGLDTWFADISATTFDMIVDLTSAGGTTAGGGVVYAGLEAMSLSSGSGNDALTTQRALFNDTLISGAGNDTLTVGGGVDVVDGGANTDLLIINWAGLSGNFTMNGPAQITNFAGTTISFSNIEQFNITLNDGASSILLLDGDDTVKGGAGSEVFNTAKGAAVVDGGAGSDTWRADQSADNAAKIIDLNLTGVQVAGNGTTYANIEAVSLSTGSGDDSITTFDAVFTDNVSTGDGSDTIKVFGGIDGVDGGLGDDLLIIDYSGLAGNFTMNGLAQITNFGGTTVSFAGIDRMDATLGNGADNIVLTLGNDTAAGGLGNDILNGGLGIDTLDWRGATGNIVITIGASGNGTVTAAGIDTDTFLGFENFLLGSGNDNVGANAGANLLDGGAGNDSLRGSGGTNTLIGGDGDDLLSGGTRRDIMTGGMGADRMSGRGGVNTFIYNSAAESGITVATRDVISDFGLGTNRLDLRAIDAITGGGDDEFTFSGVAATFAGAGDIRLEQSGANTFVRLSVDADQATESIIVLLNVQASTLTLGDFLL